MFDQENRSALNDLFIERRTRYKMPNVYVGKMTLYKMKSNFSEGKKPSQQKASDSHQQTLLVVVIQGLRNVHRGRDVGLTFDSLCFLELN